MDYNIYRIPDASRVTIVDNQHGGIVYESYRTYCPAGAEIHIQDSGRTIKVMPLTRPEVSIVTSEHPTPNPDDWVVEYHEMRDDLTYLMDEEMADALYDLYASHLKEDNKAVFCLVNGLAIHKSVHPQYATPDVVIGARRALRTSTTN